MMIFCVSYNYLWSKIENSFPKMQVSTLLGNTTLPLQKKGKNRPINVILLPNYAQNAALFQCDLSNKSYQTWKLAFFVHIWALSQEFVA